MNWLSKLLLIVNVQFSIWDMFCSFYVGLQFCSLLRNSFAALKLQTGLANASFKHLWTSFDNFEQCPCCFAPAINQYTKSRTNTTIFMQCAWTDELKESSHLWHLHCRMSEVYSSAIKMHLFCILYILWWAAFGLSCAFDQAYVVLSGIRALDEVFRDQAI